MHRFYILSAALLMLGLSAFGQEEKKMSLSQALTTAVQRNLEIQLQRVSVDSQALSLDLTRANFEPQIVSSIGARNSKSEPSSGIDGQVGQTVTSEGKNFNTRLQKTEDIGLNWNVSFNNGVSEDDGAFSIGELYSSTLTFGFSQQLLSGFSLDPEILRNDQYIARGDIANSEYDLEIQITNIIQQTENAYWDLVLAIEQLKVREQSLKLAQQLYDQNKVKIEVGTLASIELVNTEATIAQREAEIVTAENSVRAAEDRLKKVLNLPADEWVKTITPTDPLVIDEIKPEFLADLETASDNRPEMKKNNISLRNANLTEKLRRNELKPQLTLSGNYSSVGRSADRPAGFIDNDGDGEFSQGDETISVPASYNQAYSKAVNNQFPGWNVQLELTWAPFNQAAKTRLAQARANIRSAELQTEQVKLDIMESVRTSGRELESQLKSIRANEKSLKFQKENLKAEVQKFQNGLSTNYLVSEAQNNVAQAESSLNQSKINYLKALVEYYKSLGLLTQKRNIVVE